MRALETSRRCSSDLNPSTTRSVGHTCGCAGHGGCQDNRQQHLAPGVDQFGRHAPRQTCTQADMHPGRHAPRQTCTQADMHPGRHAPRQTCTQAAILQTKLLSWFHSTIKLGWHPQTLAAICNEDKLLRHITPVQITFVLIATVHGLGHVLESMLATASWSALSVL
jgi:hypothetical protein